MLQLIIFLVYNNNNFYHQFQQKSIYVVEIKLPNVVAANDVTFAFINPI